MIHATENGVDVQGACDECGMTGGNMRRVRDGDVEYLLCELCDDQR